MEAIRTPAEYTTKLEKKLNTNFTPSQQDKTRQDKTFIIKISPVKFLGTQLAENASRGAVPN